MGEVEMSVEPKVCPLSDAEQTDSIEPGIDARKDTSLSMADIRKIVLDRLKELEWSRYQLVEEAAKRGANKSSIYAWLRGERDITTTLVGQVLDALGLPIGGEKLTKRQMEKSLMERR